jgi:DNA-binding XRE family transcriptional regulator
LKGGEKMNKTKLRSVMVLHGHTNKDLADLLGISEQSVSSKINENGTEFKQGEIAKIRDEYELSPEQVDEIFFDL